MRDIDYSIVIPVYYNEGCLIPLTRSLHESVVQKNADLTGEIVFVDDGSGDGSLAELLLLREEFTSLIRIVKLTRNFGQAAALLAGYKHVRGKCVITMSADGQEPPELINEMLEAFFQEEYEIVICARAGRDESRYRIVTSKLFYHLLRQSTFKNIPQGGFDFWAMGRRAVDTLLRNSDAHTFFQERLLWMGFRTKMMSYRRRARLAGRSRYNFTKKLGVIVDLMLAHSFAPIRVMSLVGCGLSLIGFLYAALIIIGYLVSGHPVEGWPPLMIAILVIGGFQMIMLGVIGEYVWRTLTQVRRHDLYIVDEIYDSTPP